MAGYKGELAAQYFIDQLPAKTLVLYDLRIPADTQGNRFFQIDTLALTPGYALVMEVKNISGQLLFEPRYDQLIRKKKDGSEEVFPDPINQVRRQSQQLKDCFAYNKLPPLPIENLVVVANPYAKITVSSSDSRDHAAVIRYTAITSRMTEYAGQFRRNVLSQKQLEQVAATLLQIHTPNKNPILPVYQLLPSDLMTGVQCSACKSFDIVKKGRGWLCHKCLVREDSAGLLALIDYALLINKKATKKDLREFLRFTSKSSLQKWLKSLGLQYEGHSTKLVYNLCLELLLSK
ncbi:nuclease-related domain-containing protein [Fictibacillus aquaticus]|uniref:nuclease-related domain-containing protein n=1 Tax=Fictibacillus aquaticus TaxID=2021314 RepID=UPI0013FD214B|nr:nuclease-related domain-containing protein [Fictibacillus aquaticus]